MEYNVRKAEMTDLSRIEEIYAYARGFMRAHGNPNQWGIHHPPRDQLVRDIDEGTLYVIEKENIARGVFFFSVGEDPTYTVIEGGSWRSEEPYGTIHRIAGDGSGGILKTAVAFAGTIISHIRIDTHKDNRVMQNALLKLGFVYRGIIHIADGSPRLAYDKLSETKE